MLKIKALLAKILNWSGFTFDWSEWETNNTIDTWVPVFVDGKIQHKVVPRNITNNFLIETVSKQVTIPANGTAIVQIDIANKISGFQYMPVACQSTNFDVIPINIGMEGLTTTLNLFYKNISAQSQTFGAVGTILKWKSEQ